MPPASDRRILELTGRDGSAVVYLMPVGFGALELHELALRDGHWSHVNLTTASGAPVSADGSVVGHVRADGVDAIVYRGVDQHLHELALMGNTWRHTDLTVAAGAPTGPALAGTGSIATLAGPDGATVVGFVSVDGWVQQLSRGADGTVTVVYEGADFRRHELAQRDGTWFRTDLWQDFVKVDVEAGLVLGDPRSQSLRLATVGRLG